MSVRRRIVVIGIFGLLGLVVFLAVNEGIRQQQLDYRESVRRRASACVRSSVYYFRSFLDEGKTVEEVIQLSHDDPALAPQCLRSEPRVISTIWINPRAEDWRQDSLSAASSRDHSPIVICALITLPDAEQFWILGAPSALVSFEYNTSKPPVDWWDSRLSPESAGTASGDAQHAR